MSEKIPLQILSVTLLASVWRAFPAHPEHKAIATQSLLPSPGHSVQGAIPARG